MNELTKADPMLQFQCLWSQALRQRLQLTPHFESTIICKLGHNQGMAGVLGVWEGPSMPLRYDRIELGVWSVVIFIMSVPPTNFYLP